MYLSRMSVLIVTFALLSALPIDRSSAATEPIQKNTTIKSFNKAKKILLRDVYRDHNRTFYAGSEFNEKKQVSHTNGYKPKKPGKRAYRLEWEHVVPAHAFGQSFPEWRGGDPDCVTRKGKAFKGRKCVEKKSVPFRYMQADMHNLVPAVGELNGLRSNYSFAMIPGEKREFGVCDIEIEGRKCEPPPQIRGDIARTYFYMNAAYPGRGVVGAENKKLLEAWDREDPVDDWECERSLRVERIQGNANPYVKEACEEG